MGSKYFTKFQKTLYKTFISKKHLLFFLLYDVTTERQTFYSLEHEKVEFDQSNMVFCLFCYLESTYLQSIKKF